MTRGRPCTDPALRGPFGERVRALRKALGLTHAALAVRAGMASRQMVRQVEGRGVGSIETLVKLADALECTTDYLLGRAPPPAHLPALLTPEPRRDLPALDEPFRGPHTLAGRVALADAMLSGDGSPTGKPLISTPEQYLAIIEGGDKS